MHLHTFPGPYRVAVFQAEGAAMEGVAAPFAPSERLAVHGLLGQGRKSAA